jgi:hypothetical protein
MTTTLCSRIEQNKTVIAGRAIRDDPLGEMHANNLINDAQFYAGRKWQACYERVASDTLRAAEAAKTLKEASETLGEGGDRLINDILGKGLSILQVAKMHRWNNKVGREGLKRLFHLYMEKLATVDP